MAMIDLHLHSKYSGHPSDWFLKRFGTNESYTELDFIYKTAKENGMDFIALTDHNTIEGALKLHAMYLDEIIVGCEFTTYFPEDGCKVHLLTYGINEDQFIVLNKLRENIYEIRDYIKENNIAYSLAHATYSVNGKLKLEHLEKLILLFDVFEGINGSRNKIGNNTWMNVLKSLTPEIIDELYDKYKIKPFSEDPWVKGFTGGSDDHAGLFIGKTYTEVDAESTEDILCRLREKKTNAAGRHNDYKSFAFTLYKIIYDFSKSESSNISKTFFNQLTEMVFEKKEFTFINWLKAQQMKKKRKDKENFKNHLYELIDMLKRNPEINIDEKFNYIFNKISDIFDDFFKILLKNTDKSIKKGDLYNIFKDISSSLPSIFISIPFFSTIFHMYSLRPLLDELKKKYLPSNNRDKKKILWFTDTITDLNGVSVTIRNIGWLCSESKRDLKIVSAVPDEEIGQNDLPPNFINIPYFYDFKVPNYETLSLKIPSILKAVEMLYEYEPDEVYISTPGTIGFLGLFFAKLTSAKTVGVYHTDFTEQARKIVGEESILGFIETGTRWFFSCMDKIAVPTNEYINLLEGRGFDRNKMTVFRRGIDKDFINAKSDFIDKKLSYKPNTILIYAGRISKDKNLDFLIGVFNNVLKKNKNAYLVITGDGPYLTELKHENRKNDKIIFTGKVKRKELPEIFSLSDLLVFPSNTDTFGMTVLEAQCCGLPAVVTDKGGPKEIVKHCETGYVVSTAKSEDWEKIIKYVIEMKDQRVDDYIVMKQKSRTNIINNYNWEEVLQEMFEENLRDNKKIDRSNKITVVA